MRERDENRQRDIDTFTFFDALVDVPIKFEITGENEQIVAYQRCVNVNLPMCSWVRFAQPI